MLKFICLGSGSSGNSYFLFSENYGILIDAGIGIRTLKKHFNTCGLSLKQIKARPCRPRQSCRELGE